MSTYLLPLAEPEIEFFRQLFDSDLAVTLKNVEVIAGLKAKVLSAQPVPPDAPAPV
jgi:hypothetical protein